ncbi:MAG: helix-turn-helix transcriptional regulator [Gammaproteobacteria bacterium]|nr:helix-turn-helix transcriptional regulator [Gammaproteobacteria bacterium]MDP7455920.1 helix-turn-helix transcriptional regulator [Gammaproteobacteria bacterium]
MKQLRQQRNWSQPELADAIGIEQSYLSKLENDKSVPSPDMLNRILEAFDINIESLLEGMDEAEIRNHLRSIPLVNGHLQAQKEMAQRKRTNWTVASSLLCVLGLTTLTLGLTYQTYPMVSYDYGSEEIIPNGNNGETFESLQSYIDQEFAPEHAQMIRDVASDISIESAYEVLKQRYASLLSSEFRHSYNYLGNAFVERITEGQDLINLDAVGFTSGGTRTFELYNTRSEIRAEGQWMYVGGAFLLALGIFGFVVERKLYPKLLKA